MGTQCTSWFKLSFNRVEKLVMLLNAPLDHLQPAGVQCKWAAFHPGWGGTRWPPFSSYYPAVGAVVTPSSMAVLTLRCEYMSLFSEHWGFLACSHPACGLERSSALIGRCAGYANSSGWNWAGCGYAEHHVSEGEVDWLENRCLFLEWTPRETVLSSRL